MPAIARQNDTESGSCIEDGTTYSRDGEFDLSYSPDTTVDGKPAVRLGDQGTITSGPHAGSTFTVTSASGDATIDGKGIARVGDETTCDVCGEKGAIDAGSPDATAD